MEHRTIAQVPEIGAAVKRQGSSLQFFFPASLEGTGFIFLRNGREEVLAFKQEGKREIGEQVGGSLQEGADERHDAVQFGDGAVNHGGDDVGVELLAIKEIRNAEDEVLAVEIKLEAAQGELLVGAHEELDGQSEMRGLRAEGALGHDGEGVELGKGLGVQVNVSVRRMIRGPTSP